MKSKFLNALLIPIFLTFLCSGICLYWHIQISQRIPASESKFRKLESAIQLIDCRSLNKEFVISNARELVEQDKRIAELFLLMSLLFLMIGIVNLAVVLRRFKKDREVN